MWRDGKGVYLGVFGGLKEVIIDSVKKMELIEIGDYRLGMEERMDRIFGFDVGDDDYLIEVIDMKKYDECILDDVEEMNFILVS